jgi:hypothetical protein
MTLKEALTVLMQAATNDVRGSGLGIRATSGEWREKLSQAWAVAYRRVYGYDPLASDYFNAGMRPPGHVLSESSH